MKTNERVNFRMFQVPCCGHLLCWVNPRLPNYCPECGKFIYAALKTHSEQHVKIHDQNAVLTISG